MMFAQPEYREDFHYKYMKKASREKTFLKKKTTNLQQNQDTKLKKEKKKIGRKTKKRSPGDVHIGREKKPDYRKFQRMGEYR